MQILYVTDSRHGHRAWLDPSARHRVYHFADGMAASGATCRVVHIEDVSKATLADVDHVVFHRPKFTDRFNRAYHICRQSSAVLHADYDDLIFDRGVAQFSPMYLNGNRPLPKVVEYFDRNHQAASLFDNILVSTRYLADTVKRLFPATLVSVLPNSLPRLFSAPQSQMPASKYFTIGYFPGSNSHGHDLKMISSTLSQVLDSFTNVRLVIAGRLNRDEIEIDKSRLELLPYMDYNKYLSLLSKVNLSIAPLEDNTFNQAKSAVKLIESAAAGTPILVSANQDMIDHSNALSTIVENEEGWLSAFEKCINGADGTGNNSTVDLAFEYSVQNRLPLLQDHLACAA